MAWSPDFELFILATEAETLVQMSKEWDMLAEVPINQLLPGGKLTSNIITNSNLPQAQYSQAHFAPETMARKEGAPQKATRRPDISWRGDGQFFVCSSFDESAGRVMLRVWERALILHAISEPSIVGLEGVMAWRPSGSLVAASHRLPNKQEIALFERNGLKHGEFNLRGPNDDVVEAIEWSATSEILAIHLTNAASPTRSVVQLWHRSNYHWFLKQELHYARIAAIHWDAVTEALRVVTRDGSLYEHALSWDYDASQGSDATNPTYVAMADGTTLKLTPFRRLVVPPPMSAITLTMPAVICSFTYSSTYDLAIITVDNTLRIYTKPTLPPMPVVPSATPVLPNFSTPPALAGAITLELATIDLSRLRHLTWVPATSTLVAIDGLTSSTFDSVVEFTFTQTPGAPLSIAHIHRTPCHARVLRLTRAGDAISDRVVFETTNGSIHYYHLAHHRTSQEDAPISPFVGPDGSPLKLASPCAWISCATIANEESVVALSERHKLYVNNTLVAPDCNSFALHNKFLLFTTVGHLLRSLPLSLAPPAAKPQQAPQPSDKASKKPVVVYDDSVREVERGARIVAVVPHDTRVILQMPRGNLEAIAPRSLALSTIRELLGAHEYGQAFGLMRRNRIDMNFLYDHNPSDFMSHIDLFVEQVANIDYLNLFITSLRDEDTSTTLFVDLEKPRAPIQKVVSGLHGAGETVGSNKVNAICEKLHDALVKRDPVRLNLPILTTYVKRSPPALDEVLRLVQGLRGKEISAHGETIVNRLAEESLDYIVFLVDVKKLYQVALGSYDFELVLMVASKSQMDPKEYIPFLTELQALPQDFQRYRIDSYLERWASALAHLSRAGEEYEADCLDLVKDHKLFHEAIELYSSASGNKSQLSKVQVLYGEHLLQSNKFEDAAFLFHNAGAHNKALSAFKDSGNWRMALVETKLLKYTADEVRGICVDIAETLKRSSKWREASTVLTNHTNDFEGAVSVLCDGQLWLEAHTLACEHNKEELVDSIIKPALEYSTENQIKDVGDHIEEYTKRFVRLGVVRTTKLNHVPLRLPSSSSSSFNDETGSMMSGMSGLFSEGAGSVSSTMSSSTYRSTYSSSTGTFSQATKSRNKKKDPSKRKTNKVRVTGKEGSLHEEEYIVETMKKLIPTTAQQESTGNTLRALVLYGQLDQAKELQVLFKKFLVLIDQSLDLLSQSATAILPENVKEQERIREIEGHSNHYTNGKDDHQQGDN
eukprot:gene3655-4201_t